ncbi:hypothetical protein ACS0TY_024877 [Phlomoides rotata]
MLIGMSYFASWLTSTWCLGLMNVLEVLIIHPDIHMSLGHLHDMDTSSPQFTWVTHRSNHGYMAARLDRVLITAGNPIHKVTQKLKRLKFTLKAWNRDTFRNIYVVMEEAAAALTAIQA